MARYTRNSYKRKIIMFGIMLFVSIALISTGFATWVLSTQKVEHKGGNVTVGAVSNHSFTITFGDVTDQYKAVVTEPSFKFEPVKDDTDGIVKCDGKNYENMSLTFTGTINQYDFLNSFTVQMTTIPQAIRDAATAGYITLPSCVDNPVDLKTLEGAMTVDASDPQTYTFTYTITFGWGAKFGGKNPSVYYDELEPKKDIEAIDAELNEFYAAAHTADNGFEVTFTATAK